MDHHHTDGTNGNNDDDDDINYENLELTFDELYLDNNDEVEEYFVLQSPIALQYNNYDRKKDASYEIDDCTVTVVVHNFQIYSFHH